MSSAVTTATIDLEAQTQSVPSAPPAVHTHTLASPPTEGTTDPLDDFFGYTFSSSRTHESRHDRCISSDAPPPSYGEALALPAYSENAEPVTLAMYLFKFGFLFPPFWIMGAFILISPLRAPEPSPSSSWLPDKTDTERQEIIANMRSVEVKWARRCLWALALAICTGVVIGVIIWAVMRA